MWNNFFKHIDIEPQNTHILDGNATDLQAECDSFEQKITAAGGIELFVGGMIRVCACDCFFFKENSLCVYDYEPWHIQPTGEFKIIAI